jgi:hypothetical protein
MAHAERPGRVRRHSRGLTLHNTRGNMRRMFDQERALTLIAGGQSLRAIGKTLGVSAAQICAQASTDPAFAERYARAMELRADWHAAEIERIARQVERKEIPPDAARVAIDARKWTASKLRPKRYGDKLQVDADVRVQVELIDASSPIQATATVLEHTALATSGNDDTK